MSEIKRSWDVFKKIPFPSEYAGVEIQTIDVVSLDTSAAGCIDGFISSNGNLSPRKMAILRECIYEIHIILPLLNESGQAYFLDLLYLSQRVVGSIEK